MATVLGITFQQVQKYESGMNRIAATRLLDIANALSVPVTRFYEDVLTAPLSDAALDLLNRVLATADGVTLMKQFAAITRPRFRSIALRAVQEIAAIDAEMKRHND